MPADKWHICFTPSVVYTFFDSVRYLNLRDEPIPALLLQK
jgi:hypothetical protein